MSKTVPFEMLQEISSYQHLFNQYLWEATITTRLPKNMEISIASQQFVQQVLAPLSQHLKQKLAAYSVVVPATSGQPAHIHTLILSYEGDLTNKIQAMQDYVLNNLEPGTMLHNADTCLIKPIESETYYKNATKYLASNLALNGSATLHPYKKSLLTKRIKPCNV